MSELADQGGNGLRDTIEGAVASHTPSPDLDSIVNGAVEQRDRESRDRSRGKGGLDREGQTAETRRAQVRDAVTQAKQKAATAGGTQPAKASAEIPTGPPPTWDQNAKAAWNDLPQEVRLAELRQHAELKPHFERLAEFDQVLAPVRETYRQHGITSDAQAVKQLFDWESRFRNPQTRAQAFHDLARAYQVNLPELVGGAPQGMREPVSPQHVEMASRQVSQFATAERPHFENVRETMGLLIDRHGQKYITANGTVDLDKAYRDACRLDGLSVASAPRPSQPRASVQAAPRGTGKSVRDSILFSVQQARRA